MKILAISDIHGDIGLVKKVTKLAEKENVDLILIAGDHTWFEKEQYGLIGPITKTETLIVPGNHETQKIINEWENKYPNLKSLHKKHFKKDKIGFFGSGTVDWGFIDEENKIFSELKSAHEKIKHLKKKIMVTHSPPEGSKIELLGFPGSAGIRKAINKFKPDFLICGHIHEGSGLIEKIENTTVLNVSRKPTIFKI